MHLYEHLQEIEYQYTLDKIESFEQMYQGQTSLTFKINTLSDCFILRSLKSNSEADFEFLLHQHLNANCSREIVPVIHPTYEGSSYIQIEEQIFHLQSYIPPIKCDVQMEEWINVFFELRKALRSFESNHVRTNRFNTLITWEAIKESWSLDKRFPPVLEMEKNITKIVNRTSIEKQWIHADLGIWNTLFNNELFIIDFGEARIGHPYFDLAAILTSNAPTHYTINEIKHYIYRFISCYSKIESINLSLLKDFISLWFIRGALTAFKQKDFDTALYFLTMFNKYNLSFAEI
ncbi:phosphotransferase [Viridibacillus sp. NPDC093762]|uniref:phosphotransferase n=1 Tax=Viridibacillus sp. NPDC093762 TaxID=3390720 RepID=UPI003D03C158